MNAKTFDATWTKIEFSILLMFDIPVHVWSFVIADINENQCPEWESMHNENHMQSNSDISNWFYKAAR